MAKRNEDYERLNGVLTEILAIEDEALPDAKDAIKARNQLRADLKKMLIARVSLPASSRFYAGLKKTKGRVNYREVAEDIVDRHNIQDSEYAEVVEKHRKPSLRLKYGSRKDGGTRTLWQSEFEFITPEGVLS